MPKPATTQPTSSIAAAPNSRPMSTNRSRSTPTPIQRPVTPIEGTATGRAAPSAITSAPAPKLRFGRRQVRFAVDQPHLRAPDGRAWADVVGGDRDREPGPQRIEVEEERNRKAKVDDQNPSAGGRQTLGDIGEHKGQREQHENQP